MSATAFEQSCRETVKSFLQTVIVIDDGISLGDAGQSATPKTAMQPAGSILQQKPEATEEGAKEGIATAAAVVDSYSLNAKDLTDSFFKEGIVTGLFKPTGQPEQSEIVRQCVAFAKQSDVVIIDWKLEPPIASHADSEVSTRPHLATAIITDLLKDDFSTGGRLRTIIIYTAEKNLTQLRDELKTSLNEAGIKDFLTDSSVSFEDDGDYDIVTRNLKIAFYGKAHGASVADRKRSEKQLPDIVISEFVSHAKGLLPPFALQSVSAIRQNTHHLLTRFSSDLDGAYLAHRSMLPHPEDAEPFMLENFISVIRNTLSLERVDNKQLGSSAVDLWADQHPDSFSGKCLGKDFSGSATDIKEALQGGIKALFKAIKDIAKITNKDLEGNGQDSALVDIGEIIASGQVYPFAVLSSFKRSHADIGWASPDHPPYLTQGTIIATVKADGRYDDFLFCVTPKCDCLRISDKRMLSFSRLSRNEKDKSFDLVANVKGDYAFLTFENKFYKLEQKEFASDSDTKRIESIFDDSSKTFKFKDTSDCTYAWIGDLKDMNAQNRVGALVENLNRAGYDEFEWLRIKSKKH